MTLLTRNNFEDLGRYHGYDKIQAVFLKTKLNFPEATAPKTFFLEEFLETWDGIKAKTSFKLIVSCNISEDFKKNCG